MYITVYFSCICLNVYAMDFFSKLCVYVAIYTCLLDILCDIGQDVQDSSLKDSHISGC